MKKFKAVLGIMIYFVVGITRFICNMLHEVFEWIEILHIRAMRAALDFADVYPAKQLFNAVIDANAKSMTNLTHKCYLSQRFEL